jgi:hypothetical protein
MTRKNALNACRCVAAVPQFHHCTSLNLNVGTDGGVFVVGAVQYIDNIETLEQHRTPVRRFARVPTQ